MSGCLRVGIASYSERLLIVRNLGLRAFGVEND